MPKFKISTPPVFERVEDERLYRKQRLAAALSVFARWTDTRGQEPFVSLYTRLFSPSNPHVAKVDTAYRALEVKLREQTCVFCHKPDNPSKQNPLLILSYPNQALSLRHETVRQIEEKLMPPPTGIFDDQERQKLALLNQNMNQAIASSLRAHSARSATEPYLR